LLTLLRFFPRRGIKLVKGEGQYVWDSEGRRYIDFHTGHGVAFLGHRNPYVTNEIIKQVNSLMTASPVFDTEVMDDAIESLSQIIPPYMEGVSFLNSGSEAVELAIKLAFKHTKRGKLVAFRSSFHGRTLGALSLTWNPRYREPVKEILLDVVFGEFNHPSALHKVINEDTAAIFIEPIQGEGGVHVADYEFMKELEKLARSVNALLVVDEVQTGFGRTGKLWSHTEYGISPDILLAGKSIGGGFPVSAVFVHRELCETLQFGDHGSTFGGNPLTLAAVKGGVRALKEDNVVDKAANMGEELLRRLTSIAEDSRIVKEVRGKGLMVGVSLRIRVSRIIKCLQSRGVLALAAGSTVLRLLPPYLISKEDVEEVVNSLEQCLRTYGG